MPWFKLDDSFDAHPKVLAAGNEAIGLFIRCGTYCARNLTDGIVPRDIAVLYGAETRPQGADGTPGTETLADILVRVRLWHKARTGWKVHDYLIYNPRRETVIHKREIRAEAGRAGGLASGKARSKNEAKRSATVEPPSRPDPSVVDVVTDASRGSTRPQRKPGPDSSLNGAASRHPSSRSLAESLADAMPERKETP